MAFQATRDNLTRLRVYIEEGLEDAEIVARLPCSFTTVRKYRRRFQILEEEPNAIQDRRIRNIPSQYFLQKLLKLFNILILFPCHI